ncbi:MAG: S-layer homology domain-containing protein [Syntrophomonas sp.]
MKEGLIKKMPIKSANFLTVLVLTLLILVIGSARAYAGTNFTPFVSGVNNPRSVAVDSSGNIYVACFFNNRALKFDSTGTLVEEWGSSGSVSVDSPWGIAVDISGNVYVTEYYNNRILKYDSNGNLIKNWGSGGSGDGQFNKPCGVAVDSGGNVYVDDSYNYRIQKFDSDGHFIAKWGSNGSADGQFNLPFGIAVDSEGNVYVADSYNMRIQKFDSNGAFIAKWGSNGSADGQFTVPFGVAVDNGGTIYVADSDNSRIQKLDSAGHFIAKWGSNGSTDGKFDGPFGAAVDSSGNVYVADSWNSRVQRLPAPALKATSTVKGQTVTSLGKPGVTIGSVTAGSAAITAAQAADSTEAAPYVTLFDKNDSDATAKVVKYTSGGDTSNFGTDTAYGGEAVTNGDFFIIRLTASDLTTVSYYKIVVTVSAPEAPVIQSATAGDAHVDINWSPAAGATGYNIYWSATSGSYGTALATVGGSVNSYDATGLSNGTTYYFAVKATNSGGNSGYSNEVSATPQVAAPGAPVLQTPTAGSGYVSLSWGAVPGATGYNIYRSATSGFYGATLATVGGSVYSYDATGLSNGLTYYFVLKATNPGGDSGYSNEVSAVPNPPAHTVSVAANPPVGGSVAGGGIYNEGASVTVTASVYSGYRFINWTENNTQVNANSTYTFNMGAADRTLMANFSRIHSSSDSDTFLQPVNSTSGSAIINPAAGGTVSLGNDVSLSIPANALRGSSDNAKVVIQKADTPPAAPAGFMVTGTAYRFTVNGQDHYSFNNQVTLTFTFETSKIKPGEIPVIYYYDDLQEQWVNIGGKVSGNTITATVDHFTLFAIIVRQIAAPSVEPNPNPAAGTLSDITGHWAEANINELIGRGAISGYSDRTFKPDNTITRAEFATVLAKAFKLEPKSGHLFNDTSGHWAKDFIATAELNGIVKGYDSSTFGPDDPITREQMAVMIVKTAKLEQVNEETRSADHASISGWAYSAVATAIKNGIMKGYIDNSVKPQGNATRAEAVTVIVNALDK